HRMIRSEREVKPVEVVAIAEHAVHQPIQGLIGVVSLAGVRDVGQDLEITEVIFKAVATDRDGHATANDGEETCRKVPAPAKKAPDEHEAELRLEEAGEADEGAGDAFAPAHPSQEREGEERVDPRLDLALGVALEQRVIEEGEENTKNDKGDAVSPGERLSAAFCQPGHPPQE